MKLANTTVLVTGANRGIGQALVAEALRRGATRVYAGTRRPLAHPDGRVTPLTLDVTNAAQVQGAVEHVESLDLLINNAGVARRDDLSDPAVLEWHLAVNLFGTHGVTQAFLPLLAGSRGAVVNVLSTCHAAQPASLPELALRVECCAWTRYRCAETTQADYGRSLGSVRMIVLFVPHAAG